MLKITFSSSMPKTVKTLVLFAADDKKLSAELKASAKAVDFEFKKKKFHSHTGSKQADTVVLGGLGDVKDLNDKTFEEIGSAMVQNLKGEKAVVELDVIAKHDMGKAAALMAMGALLNSYSFDKYKTKDKKKNDKKKLKEITFVLKDTASAKKHFADMQKIAEGVFFTRDLVWEPANELYPESFAKRVKAELAPLGVKVKILNEAQMQKLGMWSLLSVGQGSARESHMVIMEWNGAPKSKKTKPVAFVGKGITFDTGGISLKPGAGMWDMKWDMGGAGAVVGAMKALAGRKAKANVVAAIALAENMPSDRATRPGDVVTSMSGQTIEILNTDAEGRLVLADALTYMQKNYKPELIIDLATLTGAILVALGHEFAGAFTKIAEDDVKELQCAGHGVGDMVWPMPMTDEWDKMMDSDIADVRNISMDKWAGSATAAAFLSRFIDEGQKWVHLDIAGMAWKPKATDSRPKGATGYGVRLLDQFIRQTIEK